MMIFVLYFKESVWDGLAGTLGKARKPRLAKKLQKINNLQFQQSNVLSGLTLSVNDRLEVARV